MKLLRLIPLIKTHKINVDCEMIPSKQNPSETRASNAALELISDCARVQGSASDQRESV